MGKPTYFCTVKQKTQNFNCMLWPLRDSDKGAEEATGFWEDEAWM